MVVVPGPWLVGTGFGDAEIAAVDAAGLLVETLTADFSQAAKKTNCKKTVAVRMSCFIDEILCFRDCEDVTVFGAYQ